MSILYNNDDKQVIYKYKNRNLEQPPFKRYVIEKEELIDGVTYITIRRRIPTIIHVVILLSLLVPLIFINYMSSKVEFVQRRVHTIRVPSEMYFDSRTNTIDLDITNDESNFEIISISLIDSNGTEILSMNGIEPGESIGAIPITDYTFESLPSSCKIIYKATSDGFIFKDIERDVLIVDRLIADKEQNNDF